MDVVTVVVVEIEVVLSIVVGMTVVTVAVCVVLNTILVSLTTCNQQSALTTVSRTESSFECR